MEKTPMNKQPVIRPVLILLGLSVFSLPKAIAQNSNADSNALLFSAVLEANYVQPQGPIGSDHSVYFAAQCSYPISRITSVITELGTTEWDETFAGGYIWFDPIEHNTDKTEVSPRSTRGRVIEFKFGVSTRISPIFKERLFISGLLGIRVHHERWNYHITLLGWDSPRVNANTILEIMEMQLGLDVIPSVLGIQASYRVNHAHDPDTAWPPITTHYGFRFGIRMYFQER
jgi:hypothetical protein